MCHFEALHCVELVGGVSVSKTGFGVKAPLPAFIEPALATSIEKVPAGSAGFTKLSSTATVFRFTWPTRRSRSSPVAATMDQALQEGAHDAWRIKAASAVIDGEIVVPAADGTTDFSVLQNELKGSSKSIVLVAFPMIMLRPKR
jgi:bifunctional non-homologous end joining protein LigD